MQAAAVMTSDILVIYNRLIQTETVRAAHCGPIDPGPTRYMAPSCNKLFDVFLQTLSACNPACVWLMYTDHSSTDRQLRCCLPPAFEHLHSTSSRGEDVSRSPTLEPAIGSTAPRQSLDARFVTDRLSTSGHDSRRRVGDQTRNFRGRTSFLFTFKNWRSGALYDQISVYVAALTIEQQLQFTTVIREKSWH